MYLNVPQAWLRPFSHWFICKLWETRILGGKDDLRHGSDHGGDHRVRQCASDLPGGYQKRQWPATTWVETISPIDDTLIDSGDAIFKFLNPDSSEHLLQRHRIIFNRLLESCQIG